MRKWFDKFAAWLCGFGIDKYIHIIFAAIVAMLVARVCFFAGANRVLAGFIGFFAALVAGLLKEVYDSKTTKVFDGKDIIADVVGAVLFFLIWL